MAGSSVSGRSPPPDGGPEAAGKVRGVRGKERGLTGALVFGELAAKVSFYWKCGRGAEEKKLMSEDFELRISPEFLEKAEQDMTESLEKYGDPKLFTAYNRGGGPKGSYDRHYDKSTGK